MGLYRDDSSSEVRLRFGRRLENGLKRYEETAGLVPALVTVQDNLAAAVKNTAKLEEAADIADDDLEFAEHQAEQRLRRCHSRCRELDGDRVGAVTRAVFPDGLTAAIAPKGESQGKAIDEVRTRIDRSELAKVVAAKADLLALADEAKAIFDPAYQAWTSAFVAHGKAFATEKIRREEHRRTASSIIGGIREAFPDDTAIRKLVIPSTPSTPRRRRAAVDDDEGGGSAGGDST